MELINKQLQAKISSSILVAVLSGKFIVGRFIVLINLISVLVSWHFNKSIAWAIFHYFFGWWYLIYCTISYRFANGAFLEIIKSYF